MPAKSLYQDRKCKDLAQLESRVADLAAKVGTGDGEAAEQVERLRHRYRDAENRFARP